MEYLLAFRLSNENLYDMRFLVEKTNSIKMKCSFFLLKRNFLLEFHKVAIMYSHYLIINNANFIEEKYNEACRQNIRPI